MAASGPFPVTAFSHADGFPAGTYRVMFEAWQAVGFEVVSVERFGHDTAYPVSSNWPRLRNELIACVERRTPGRQVHFVGHSLGGCLSLKAACKRRASGPIRLPAWCCWTLP